MREDDAGRGQEHVEPSPPTHEVRVLAHRGASARWPEHSRAAYEQALADGADGLECDVRLTADHVPVLWHDATVERTSDGHGAVHEHTLDEMRGLDLGVPGGSAGQLLTLTDLLSLARDAGRPVELAVELKHPTPSGFRTEDLAVDALSRAGWDPGSGRVGDVGVTFMSFHPGSLAHLAGTAGVLPRDLVALTDELDVPGMLAELAPGAGSDAAVVDHVQALVDEARAMVDDGRVATAGPSVAYLRARPGTVERWVRRGARLRVWTVDRRPELDTCLAAGVHEVTTNDPAGIRAMLGPAVRRATP